MQFVYTEIHALLDCPMFEKASLRLLIMLKQGMCSITRGIFPHSNQSVLLVP